jgi:N-acyl homoserine lactone hydrolase
MLRRVLLAVKKLSLLNAGYCRVDQSILDARVVPGQSSINLPIWVYLIDTTDGPILVDTGMPSSCVKDPVGLFKGEDDGSIVPQMKQEDIITNILKRNGHRPEDLACVISSHLHFDHAGGNEFFPQTEIVLQSAEYEAAMNGSGYVEVCKLPHLKYKQVTGDVEYAPGIHLISTPGHSPGHQSVLVQTRESGNVLLTIDAAYTRSNFEEGVPFAVQSQNDAASSIAKLKQLAKSEQAKIFFGHDTEQAKHWSEQLVFN